MEKPKGRQQRGRPQQLSTLCNRVPKYPTQPRHTGDTFFFPATPKTIFVGGQKEKKGVACMPWLGGVFWNSVAKCGQILWPSPSFWLFHRSKYGPFQEMATLFLHKFKIPAACCYRPGSAISKTGFVFSEARKTNLEIEHEHTYIHTYILASFIIIDN